MCRRRKTWSMKPKSRREQLINKNEIGFILFHFVRSLFSLLTNKSLCVVRNARKRSRGEPYPSILLVYFFLGLYFFFVILNFLLVIFDKNRMEKYFEEIGRVPRKISRDNQAKSLFFFLSVFFFKPKVRVSALGNEPPRHSRSLRIGSALAQRDEMDVDYENCTTASFFFLGLNDVKTLA